MKKEYKHAIIENATYIIIRCKKHLEKILWNVQKLIDAVDYKKYNLIIKNKYRISKESYNRMLEY